MPKDAVGKRYKPWEEMEKTILELVKEHARLSGILIYRALEPEVEKLIKGGD